MAKRKIGTTKKKASAKTKTVKKAVAAKKEPAKAKLAKKVTKKLNVKPAKKKEAKKAAPKVLAKPVKKPAGKITKPVKPVPAQFQPTIEQPAHPPLTQEFEDEAAAHGEEE